MLIKNEDLTNSLAEYLRTNSKGFKLLTQGQLPVWSNDGNKFYPPEFELCVNLSNGYSAQDVINAFTEQLKVIATSESYVTLRDIKSVPNDDFTFIYTYVSSLISSAEQGILE